MRRTWFLPALICGVATNVAAVVLGAGPPARSLRVTPRAPSAAIPLPAAAVPAAAAPRAAQHGLSKAAGDTARTTHGLSRASASLSRVPATARPNLSGIAPPGSLPGGEAPPLDPSQRGHEVVRAAARNTLDQRLQQADHLDAIAKQNGNENLGATAERMRDQAQQQYDGALQRLDGTAPVDGFTPGTEPDPSALTAPRMPVPNATAPKAAWRDRLHFARPFAR